MANVTRTRRVHCPLRHVNAFITEYEDGGHKVKCGLLRACGDSCPYLKNPNYRSEYKAAPEYKPKETKEEV